MTAYQIARFFLKYTIVALVVVSSSVGFASAVGLVVFSNGEQITKDDLNDYIEKRVDMRGMARNTFGVEAILTEMAMTRALVLEGQATGVPSAQGKTITRFDDIYGHSVFQKTVRACPSPQSMEEKREYFEANPDAFHVPAMARLSRIMLPAAVVIGGNTASETLFKWAQALSAGTDSFETYAQQAELHYGLDTQGDLGWVNLNEDMPIMRALSAARQGELLGPVAEGDFLYLFYVAGKRDARRLTWEEALPGISQRAVTYCAQQEKNKTIKNLFKKYGIQIQRDMIKQSFPVR